MEDKKIEKLINEIDSIVITVYYKDGGTSETSYRSKPSRRRVYKAIKNLWPFKEELYEDYE